MPTHQREHLSYSRLFDLPLEIREHVWENVLHAKSGTNLLLTNREVYQDVAPVFYRSKTFRVKSPSDFRTFAASSGPLPHRSKLIRYLDLAIDCLYITDHATQDIKLHLTLPWQSGRELAVNQGLRAWGTIFDDWHLYGFASLRLVRILFRQFAMYHLRTLLGFTDPTELWRFMHKLSRSALVFGGTKDIMQSGLLTMSACCAFEHLIEKRCALEAFARDHEAGPQRYPGMYGTRDRHFRAAMEHVHQRNAHTQLEILQFAAHVCNVTLHQADIDRLNTLRE